MSNAENPLYAGPNVILPINFFVNIIDLHHMIVWVSTSPINRFWLIDLLAWVYKSIWVCCWKLWIHIFILLVHLFVIIRLLYLKGKKIYNNSLWCYIIFFPIHGSQSKKTVYKPWKRNHPVHTALYLFRVVKFYFFCIIVW